MRTKLIIIAIIIVAGTGTLFSLGAPIHRTIGVILMS
jgi:hypothetical protein